MSPNHDLAYLMGEIETRGRVPLWVAVEGDAWLRAAYDACDWSYPVISLLALFDPQAADRLSESEYNAHQWYAAFGGDEPQDDAFLAEAKRLCPCPTVAALAEAVARSYPSRKDTVR